MNSTKNGTGGLRWNKETLLTTAGTVRRRSILGRWKIDPGLILHGLKCLFRVQI